jgi:tetratricopeptide (TPR) repeat protein
MEVLAARDAIAHYGRALRLLEERADGRALRATLSARELRRLYVNLARAHELDDEWERARATYREMLESEREPELRWTALNRLAILSVQRSHDVEGATALLEEALRVAAESDDRNMLAGTEWNLAQVAGFGYEPDAALAHGEKALGLARDLGLPELTARALYTLAFAHGLAGRWEEAAAHAEEARQSYAKMGNRTTDARALSAQYVWAGSPPSRALYVRAMGALCLSALSVAKVNLGEPRAGVDLGRAALDVSAGIGNAWVRWVSAGDLSYGLVELGRYGEALRVAREGVELARKLPNPTVPFFAFTMLGNAYQATLGLEDARVAYLEALSRTDAAPVRPHKTMVLSKLCANRALAGDQDGAYAYAQESVAARRETPTLLVRFDLARHHETEALLRGGSEGLAREDLREFGECVGANRRFRVPYLRMLAVLARWDGEPGEAIRHLREAGALAEEIGLPGELWQIEAELGELHERNGRRAEARSAFSRAAEIVRKLAGNLEDGAPRAGFFGTPQVQGVLER